MPSTRPNISNANRYRETAEGQGCFSGFALPPLIALVIGISFLVFLGRFSPDTGPAAVNLNNGLNLTTIGHEDSFLSPIFTSEIQFWGQEINQWAGEFDLDPNLIATVMQIESCGNPDARSSAGAMGLFQVMPFHFQPFDNPYDPDTNARRGMAYLKRSLIAAGGDPGLALAGYNGGISLINQPQSNWPEETQRYLYWGSGIYADAASGTAESPRLNEWLGHAGGLCASARSRLNMP